MYLGPVGLICAVGLDAPSACAAMRAGIAGFEELPYWDSDNLPVIGARVPGLSDDLQFGPRLVEMLAQALTDCLSTVSEFELETLPLLVGLAEVGRPGGGGALQHGIVAQVEKKLGVRFHADLSAALPEGHTAGFAGLRLARDLLRAHAVPACVVCGVDSYINASSIYWLDRHWRLKRERHTDGVIPGEAAAAVLVLRQAPSTLATCVEIAGLGYGLERAPVLSSEPLLGRGLASACSQALREAGWGFHDLDFRITDMTGENYGFREHVLAEGRLVRIVRSQAQPVWHAADSIGDTGAAAGVVQLATGAAALIKGYAPGPRVACFTSAVNGARSVVALQRTNLFRGSHGV